ncbi:glycosyl transferase family 1 [Aquitalea magnusonii]|uniref:Glycosyl transferase family 1 n=1 Tax=Aquitalea magnusonii TaxID=332411 RepID=A0A318J9F0_9NEIS|nr:glycosyl transferase family 1 [Aquitalea magnusonii]
MSDRLILLVNSRASYYFSLGLSLLKGFQQVGVDCKVIDWANGEAVVVAEIARLQPTVVFEINKTRNQSGIIPSEVIHIGWIHDSWYIDDRSGDKKSHCYDQNFGGSEITYFLLNPEYFALESRLGGLLSWSLLKTGVDIDQYYPCDTITNESAASICGYIPEPLSVYDEFLGMSVLSCSGKSPVTAGYLIDRLMNYYKVSVAKHSVRDVYHFITTELNQKLGLNVDDDFVIKHFGNHWLLLLMDTELPRMNDRFAVAEGVVSAGLQLSIYGPGQWERWPKFKPFYKRNLCWSSELADVYRATRFNIHNGALGMHSRVLDIMACSGVVFVNKNSHGNVDDIESNFTAGIDYIEYEMESISDDLSFWIGREKQLVEVGRSALEKVRTGHQWKHRALQILTDINELRHIVM